MLNVFSLLRSVKKVFKAKIYSTLSFGASVFFHLTPYKKKTAACGGTPVIRFLSILSYHQLFSKYGRRCDYLEFLSLEELIYIHFKFKIRNDTKNDFLRYSRFAEKRVCLSKWAYRFPLFWIWYVIYAEEKLRLGGGSFNVGGERHTLAQNTLKLRLRLLSMKDGSFAKSKLGLRRIYGS